jgi:hypothetical protein
VFGSSSVKKPYGGALPLVQIPQDLLEVGERSDLLAAYL